MWSPASARAAASPRLLTVALLMLASTSAITASLGSPLVPLIAKDQGVSLAAAQWVLTVTFLAAAVLTPVCGRLGGGRHRRAVLLTGLGLVVGGCMLSAIAWNLPVMLLGRMGQGVGLGLTPIAIATARELLDEPRRDRAIAGVSVTVVSATGLGYPLASFLVSVGGVPTAYWAGAVLGAITLTLCAVVIPPAANVADPPLDLMGTALLGGGAAATLLGVSQSHVWGVGDVKTLLVAAAAVVLLALWVWWTLRIRHPLVDLRLAMRPGVLAGNATALLGGMGLYMVLTMAVLIVQAPSSTDYGLGYSVTVAGAMLVPFSLTSLVASRLRPRLALVLGRDLLLPAGCLGFAAGALSMALWRTQLWQVAFGMALVGFGSALAFSSIPGLMMRFVPLRETGSAMSFNQILRFLGFSTGSALVVTVIDAMALPDGELTSQGFRAVGLIAMTLCLASVLASWLLARAAPADQYAA